MRRVQEYMPLDARVWHSTETGKRGAALSMDRLKTNAFYTFNTHAMSALSHAIEDLALDRAEGRLYSIFNSFETFEKYKEKYWQLGATLEEVVVLGTGKTPKRQGQLRFASVRNPELKDFWILLYSDAACGAMLSCKKTPEPDDEAGTLYSGFFGLDREIVRRNQEDLLLTARSASRGFREFERFKAIDRVRKGVHGYFLRESILLDRALNKLASNESQPDKITGTLSRSLQRLQQLQSDIAKDLDPPASSKSVNPT